MKSKFTSLTLLFVSLLFVQNTLAQTLGDYRSAGSGGWSSTTLWERWDGLAWLPIATPPGATDGVITIQSGNNVTVDVAVVADQIVVAAGGTLAINSLGFNLTVNDDGTAANDLIVNGGILLGGFNSLLSGTGAPTFQLNGTMIWTSGELQVPTTISATGVANLLNDFTKNLSANLVNNGILNWGTGATAGGIYFSNATLTNNGTVNENFSSDRGFFGVGGVNSFINNGIFSKNTSFIFASFNVPIANNATIQGIGGLDLTGGAGIVNGAGAIYSPGTAGVPGILTSSDGIISANSKVNIDIISGLTPGTGHDQLAISGSNPTTLNGALEVTDNPGAPLGVYTIVTTGGTFSGTFSSVIKPSNFGDPVYLSNSVTIEKLSALPLTWGSFMAISKNNQVQLIWSTLQESNTSHFVIEHSTNTLNYTAIGNVAASGNSGSELKYQFTHTNPNLAGYNYYRIRQVDLDGKGTYSLIKFVRFENNEVVTFQVTPNPVRNMLQLNIQAKDITVILSDMNGQLIRNWKMPVGTHQVNVQDLPAGTYQITVYQKSQRIGGQRIIKL